MTEKNIYANIRIAGLLALIPIIMAAGPVTGYIVADILIKKFGLPDYTTVICAILGVIAGARETVRIIRIALKARGQV